MEHTDCELICIKKSPNRKSEHQEAPSRTKQKKKKKKKRLFNQDQSQSSCSTFTLGNLVYSLVNSKTYEKNN